jgi:hypothetical protein
LLRLRVLSILLFATVAQAQPDPTDSGKENLETNAFVRGNIKISEKIDRLAIGLDRWLVGERYHDRKNSTTLLIENRVTTSESQDKDLEYDPHLSLELHLPNTERKWSARFSSYDEDERSTGIQRHRLRTTRYSENYGASISFLKKLGNMDISFKPRLQADRVSHTIAFDSRAQYKDLEFAPKLELFGRSDTGTGQYLSLNITYLANDENSFVLVNDQQYVDVRNQHSTNHGLIWNHFFDDKTRTHTSLVFEGESKPKNYHLSRYVTAVGIDHTLYKRVLVLNFTPYIIFVDEPAYRRVHGVNLNLSIIL